MITKIAVSLMFAAFATVATGAEDLGNIAKEVVAGDITMQVNDTGSITVKSCSSCQEHEFLTTPNTTYEIGDEQVGRESLRLELLRRPRQLTLLQLTLDRKHVARLKISATAQ